MKKDEAKKLIVAEWDAWAPKNVPPDRDATGTHALAFFGYLGRERSYLLAFRSSGDPWQTVHGWLLQAGRVKD